MRLPGVETPDRVVAHVDMDCFYAACERLREPGLAGEPVVVGMGYEDGDTHGAVATASYEAREFGVESAMPISEALERLPRMTDAGEDPEFDPEDAGYYRPVDMAFYKAVSRDVKAVLYETAEVVREVSIDEAYLDLGEVDWRDVEAIAEQLKADIEAEAGVTASVGVAPNMSTAKLASDADKPDGLVVVEPDAVEAFLAPLAVDELHGVGPVTAGELRELGFETAGDIADVDPAVLVDRFGERGRELHAQARGHDERPVEPVGRPKSLSKESSLGEATADVETKRETVRRLAAQVADRAAGKGALYRTIGVKVVTPPYDVNTRERSLPGPVDDPELLEATALELLAEFTEARVRKLGVRVSNLSFDDRDQANLDDWTTTAADPERFRARHSDRDRGAGQADLTDFT